MRSFLICLLVIGFSIPAFADRFNDPNTDKATSVDYEKATQDNLKALVANVNKEDMKIENIMKKKPKNHN